MRDPSDEDGHVDEQATLTPEAWVTLAVILVLAALLLALLVVRQTDCDAMRCESGRARMVAGDCVCSERIGP